MASLTKVRFLALQIDLKGRTDYNTQSLLEWISATTSFLFGEGPEPGSMSRAGSLQSRGTHSAQTMFSGLTRRKEGQQQFLQKVGKAVCYGPGRSVNHLNKPEDLAKTQQETLLIWLCSPENNPGSCTWILAGPYFSKEQTALIHSSNQRDLLRDEYYLNSVSKQEQFTASHHLHIHSKIF